MIDIIHVTDSLGMGGAEQSLLSMIRRLGRLGYRSHLAWLYDDERCCEPFESHVASFVPLFARRPSGLFGAAARLARWMINHRPQVAHAQLARAQLVTRAASFATRVPMVTTWQNVAPHEREPSDFGGSNGRSLFYWADTLSSRVDRKFIAVSEQVARSWAERVSVSRGRISVVHNSVEPERYAPVPRAALEELRRQLGLRDAEKVLLSVGRLVSQKRQAELIAAMPRVLSECPNAVLLVAGNGPLLADLESKARALLLGDRVRFLGQRTDVPALYQMADVFVFPSSYEGLSVALLEALANGLPAVVSNIPQNLEICDGIPSVKVVSVGDVEAFSASVVAVLQSSTSFRWKAAEAAAGIHATFNPRDQAKAFDAIVRPLVRHESPSSS